jgi:hypothetical protein
VIKKKKKKEGDRAGGREGERGAASIRRFPAGESGRKRKTEREGGRESGV